MTRRTGYWTRRWLVALIPAMAALLAGCGASSGPASTPAPLPETSTSTVPEKLGLVVSPEFVQGVIPGQRLVLLVSVTTDQPVMLSCDVSGGEATVSIEPETISENQVAEITVVPGAATTETELRIDITARDEDLEETITKTTAVFDWPDDRQEQAAEILGVFTAWLADNEPALGITPATRLEGSFVSTLLVVSHYAYFNDDWEVGVSWHIMLPPDDFAEVYLRPRDALRPERAFRIASWQTALETGVTEVIEVEPPAEVTR